MKTIESALFASAAALLLSGAVGFAATKSPPTHMLTLQLPGGGIEQIRYEGSVPPQVVVAPDGWASVSPAWPAAFFGADSALAQMDRISAAMDRQMQTMLQDADSIAADPGLWTVDTKSLPAGSQSYSFVSTMSGNRVCGRSVEITATGNHEKPHVVSRSFGDCGNGHAGVTYGAPAQDQPANVREVRYAPAPARAPAIREASAIN